MHLGNLVFARGLVLAAGSVALGLFLMVAWYVVFFAASNRDPWIVWALYFVTKAVWLLLVFGGLAAFLGIAVLMGAKRFGG